MFDSKAGTPLEGFAEFATAAAAEGAVLLRNNRGMLPLNPLQPVSLFGRTQIDYYRSGTGSGGAVNVVSRTTFLQAMRERSGGRLNEQLAALYESWIEQHPFDNGGGGWAAEPWYQQEMPLSDEQIRQARAVSTQAVIVLGRTAGEDQDNADVEGGYRLTADEKHMLHQVCREFDEVAVVLNTAGLIDLSWADDPLLRQRIRALLYVWHGGAHGAQAAASLLYGDVTPSGKLVGSIVISLDDHPASPCWGAEEKNLYQEDIYVGYRYFETFSAQSLQFPFGFGLSYTSFTLQSARAETFGDLIKATVTVTNRGERFAGKEVVQIYLQAPQGALGKPAKALVAFAKTRLLQPGESETLTLSIPLERFASLDDSGATGHPHCYVMEPGLYRLLLGNSVRDLQPLPVDGEAGYAQKTLRILSCHQQVLAPTVPFVRIKPVADGDDGRYQIEWEDVPRREINLRARIEERLPEAITLTGNQGLTLNDVAEGRTTMNAFVAQLSVEELACLVRGEGMCSHKVTPGVASAFGGVADSLLEKGIPLASTADGPSGIRMDNGAKATLLPSGTLLASSWDPILVERLYVMEGKELLRNGIDLLLGPGMNIQRHPLNGRNFEYFSEDPLLTGMMAAAVVRGIRSGGGIATLKHFACNNQEFARAKADSVVSERALREIYLKGFEYAVKSGGANAVMTAYNPVNGHHAASNYDLTTTVLREEWGFRGIVMTDWWATMNDPIDGGAASTHNTAAMIRAQNDLYMVVNNNGAEVNAGGDNTLAALATGELTLGELQRCAINILDFMLQTQVFKRGEMPRAGIIRLAADPACDGACPGAIKIAEQSRLRYDEELVLSVERTAVYDVLVSVHANGAPLAQTACNLLLNEQFVATIQTNGTLGREIVQKLCRIELQSGKYRVDFDFIKPGLVVDWLELRLVND
ncbi:glycoside hydrolase family 3 C-terminal domain-containing protein [Klebsiella michiganensis]|uniref:beta-glucosidase n=1 Tax=Klebsiella michiganensis TaxID=1134687 RepID=UPI001A9177EA|nr:glycoside hydrolase family 3 N-terminal domain-containing protein [Klebsiella michiganensis]QSW16506.1 glycoside hydrolase family 3 C-terminal domain-containing protein [Klebsiella michiganensis]